VLDKGDDFYRARLSRHVLSAWYFHLIACFLVVTLFFTLLLLLLLSLLLL